MTFRTNLLKTVNRLRRLPGPPAEGGRFDVYTATVTRRLVSWSGGSVKLGTATTTDLELRPRPKVREVSGDDVLRVGPVTPQNAVGGYSPSQLNPTSLAAGEEFYYVVVGPFGTKNYALTAFDTGRAFSYYLTLEALERKRPF
jgi:hypothetical protein